MRCLPAEKIFFVWCKLKEAFSPAEGPCCVQLFLLIGIAHGEQQSRDIMYSHESVRVPRFRQYGTAIRW